MVNMRPPYRTGRSSKTITAFTASGADMDGPIDSWKLELQPLNGVRRLIPCDVRFSHSELACLREGIWPRDIDDRWMFWLYGQTLRCWRSWTTLCIYEAEVEKLGSNGGRITVLRVLEDPSLYMKAVTDEIELTRFQGVMILMRQMSTHKTE